MMMKSNAHFWRIGAVTLLVGGALQLAWALPIPGLYNTGVDDSGVLLGDDTVDPHYQLIESADLEYMGPEARTLLPGWPVGGGVWLDEGPNSRWIAPRAQQGIGNAEGNYTYRTTFDLTGYDPAKARISGGWAVDNGGVDVVLNGTSLGLVNTAGFGGFTEFSIESGFVGGENTLDFIVSNAPTTPNPTALRVEMIGLVEVAGEAPRFIEQPVGGVYIDGETVTLSVWADGTAPLSYQWQRNGEDVNGATESTLELAGVTTAQAGEYAVLVSNDVDAVLSDAVTIDVFERVPGLFNTGVDDAGAVTFDGDLDYHYVLVVNPDNEWPEPTVQESTAFPISDGTWVRSSDRSAWVGPQFNTSGAAAGDYVYELEINLAGFDPTTVFITGRWASDNNAVLLLNGLPTGITSTSMAALVPFRLEAGFLSGINKLQFKVSNDGLGYTGLRVEDLRGGARTGTAVADPRIVTAPVGGLALTGDSLVLNVLTDGTQPMSYQWERNGSSLGGETGATLELSNITVDNAGDYTVLVTNSKGSVRSAVATVKVLERVPGVFDTGVDDQHAVLADNSADTHYRLTVNPDNAAVTEPLVQDSTVFPIVGGTWLFNSDLSKWIGPRFETSAAAGGDYTYELTFDLTGFDPGTAILMGNWATDNVGLDLKLNGTSTGLQNNAQFGSLTAFSLESGFQRGVNTLEFVVNNASEGYTGLRVENLRVGALPGGAEPPALTVQLAGADARISWPSADTGFSLKSVEGLTGSTWAEVNAPVVVEGDRNVVTVPIEGTTRFFRLEK
ncbi:MAG: immunoglobulin domain-containing protein [Verrucomicrobia bacterium]|nr:immunoglobulin domain-containing protein [Verrucomicrobiota bacterium]